MRISDWSSDVCSSDLGARSGMSSFASGLATASASISRPPISFVFQVADRPRTPPSPSWFFGGWAARSASVSSLTMRSEEHTSELQSLMRNSYAVFCLKKIQQLLDHTQHNSDHYKTTSDK